MSARVVVYVDGGCRGNGAPDPRERKMRAVITDADGLVLFDQQRAGGSNNIAELWAMVEAIEWAAGLELSRLEIRTDSQNAIAWTRRRPGKKVVDPDSVAALQRRLVARSGQVDVVYTWVPRRRNVAGIYLDRNGP